MIGDPFFQGQALPIRGRWQREKGLSCGPRSPRAATVGLVERAADVKDLRSPPGNRLEKLSGDREGQYSIRINGQWRICFLWSNGGADDVEIVDYH